MDYAAEHPSVSKQHAVLQFRFTEGGKGEGKDEWGVMVVEEEGRKRGGGVRPYVIDLESANGTWVNGERVPERRFVEVRSGDVVTFGESARLVGGVSFVLFFFSFGWMDGWVVVGSGGFFADAF